jgi:MFS family permease
MILIIGQFVLGFGSYSIFPIGYTLIADFFSDKFRPIAVIIVNSIGYLFNLSNL